MAHARDAVISGNRQPPRDTSEPSSRWRAASAQPGLLTGIALLGLALPLLAHDAEVGKEYDITIQTENVASENLSSCAAATDLPELVPETVDPGPRRNRCE